MAVSVGSWRSRVVHRFKESALSLVWFKRGGTIRTTLVINDILAHVRHPHGIGAHIMARVLSFGVNRPRIPRIGKWMFVKDRKALAGGFRKWANEPGLVRVIVSHGDVIVDQPRSVLERVAAELEP